MLPSQTILGRSTVSSSSLFRLFLEFDCKKIASGYNLVEFFLKVLEMFTSVRYSYMHADISWKVFLCHEDIEKYNVIIIYL